MKITLLGGGNEVGASCIHVEINDTRLLIDAGMRMHQDDPLPAIGMLDELGGIDAVLITHAHADHIGALPLIKALYPEASFYATPPTMDLMRIMMKDSFRILESRCMQEKRLMPYSEQQMYNLLESVLAFPANGNMKIREIEISLYNAGHILGAVMLGITGGGERLLVTGDLSFRAGRTIPGAKVPYDLNPDVVVMESTYGNRMHLDRNTEEKRLAENVAEVVASGGFALIPAFALGRSQEILLILQDYMERGLIPSFPIYADGMVTPVCQIYRGYPQYLKGPVAHRIRQHGDAFLNENRCIAVRDRKHREQIIQGKPGCIVASSGMLIGGASLWYAEQLIGGEKNAIFITGYQDEESPGRKLLALAEGAENTLDINGVTHEVRCKVGKYGLSAHADAMEMTGFIEKLAPAHTLLVHGDGNACYELSQRIDGRFGPVLTENLIVYEFIARDSRKGIKGKNYALNREQSKLYDWVGHLLLLKDDKQLYPAICIGFHSKMRTLLCQSFHKKNSLKVAPSEVVESLGAWNGSILDIEEKLMSVSKYSRPVLESLNWKTLEEGRHYELEDACQEVGAETPDQKLAVALALQALPESHIYQVPVNELELPRYITDSQVLQELQELRLPIQGIRMDMATALDAARDLLGNHPRFARVGGEEIDGRNPSIVIYFDFPDAVGEEERLGIFAELHRQTGWVVRFSDSVRQDQLVQLARSLMGNALTGNPSIHQQTRQLVVDGEPHLNWEEIQGRFFEQTGYKLVTKNGGPHASKTAGTGALTVQPPIRKPPMEVNKAQQEMKLWSREIAATIYKAGIRQTSGDPMMELHFISPQVGKRYLDEMEMLADRIGMSVGIAANPKQNEIIAAVKELLPSSWGVVKNPSLHMDKAVVTVKCSPDAALDPKLVNKIKSDIYELTGYELQVINT